MTVNVSIIYLNSNPNKVIFLYYWFND